MYDIKNKRLRKVLKTAGRNVRLEVKGKKVVSITYPLTSVSDKRLLILLSPWLYPFSVAHWF